MRINAILRIIILAGMIILQSFAFAQEPLPTIPDLQISLSDRLNVFDKAWETVNKNFFDPKFNGVNWPQMKGKYRPLAEAATDKAQLVDVLQKMLNELHASHMAVSGGVQYGTGVGYFQIDGKWIVRWVAPDSPAQRAGMERGWVLTGSEGDCAAPKRKVALQYLDLKEQPRSLELSCAAYPAMPEPAGSFQALEKGAVYLRLTSFTPGPGNWLADQVARNKSANTIVLDLRDNWGGGLETAKKVFDLFFSEKTVIGKFSNRKGKEFTLKASGDKSAYRGRIFVLTDRYTGSAAEVFASAIQESGRGVVVGQQSKGGVLGATHYKLPNGFDLHVALMDYHTAKGTRLEGRGVIPDVAVDLTVKDFQEGRDAVLDRANQMLQLP
jgi:carboxyl-terminal processing protease